MDEAGNEVGTRRTFPGGRDVLLQAVLGSEIDRFFTELAAVLDPLVDLEDLVTAGVGATMRFLDEHAALHTIVRMEPGLLLPQFAFHRLDLVLASAAAFAAPYLEPHVGSADDAWSAAEHLTRIVLTYTMHPDPAVDPSDDESIRQLVRHLVLPGLTAGTTVHEPVTEPRKTHD